MIKLCVLQSDILSIEALNFILRVVQESNKNGPSPLGAPVRFYGEATTANGKEFYEWGLVCEKGTVCSRKKK